MREPPVEMDSDGVHARPRRTGRDLIDLALAVSAIAISLVSLFIAVQHGRTEREDAAASTWPFPVVHLIRAQVPDQDTAPIPDASDRASSTTRVIIRNLGNGPARFKWIRISLDGKVLRSPSDLLAACCSIPANASPAELLRHGVVGDSSDNGAEAVVEAHRVAELLAIDNRDPATGHALETVWPRMHFEACFCSVLRECWRSDLWSTTDPTPVAACRPGPDDYHD